MMSPMIRLVTVSAIAVSLSACSKLPGNFWKPEAQHASHQAPAYYYGASHQAVPGQSAYMSPSSTYAHTAIQPKAMEQMATQMQGHAHQMEKYAAQAAYASPPPARLDPHAHLPQAPVLPTPQQRIQAPTVTTTPASPAASQGLDWYQAMALMYQGQVESAMQTHNGQVVLYMRNGQRVATQTPQMDDVLRVKQACGAPCATMMIATQ